MNELMGSALMAGALAGTFCLIALAVWKSKRLPPNEYSEQFNDGKPEEHSGIVSRIFMLIHIITMIFFGVFFIMSIGAAAAKDAISAFVFFGACVGAFGCALICLFAWAVIKRLDRISYEVQVSNWQLEARAKPVYPATPLAPAAMETGLRADRPRF